MNRALLGMFGAATLTASTVAAPVSAHAAAIVPTAITNFKISTSAQYRLTVSGKLTAKGLRISAGEPLTIETARPTRAGGWERLPLHDTDRPLETTAGGAFSGTYWVLYPTGHYRIRYAGNLLLSATLSGEVRDPRVVASVGNFRVSAKRITKGSTVTFSGVLRRYPDGRKGYAYRGQQVLIAARLKGAKEWYWYARPKTDSKGRFKTKIKISRDAYWEWFFPGNRTHYLDYLPKPVFIDVR